MPEFLSVFAPPLPPSPVLDRGDRSPRFRMDSPVLSPISFGEGGRGDASIGSAAGSNYTYQDPDLVANSPNQNSALDEFHRSQLTIRPPRLERRDLATSPVQIIRQDFLGEWLQKEKPDSVVVDLQGEYENEKGREYGTMSSGASYRKVEVCSPSLMESIEERDYAILERKRRRDAEKKESQARWRGRGAGNGRSMDRAKEDSTSDRNGQRMIWWQAKKWWIVALLTIVVIAVSATLGVLLKRDHGRVSETVSPTTCIAHYDSFGGSQQIAQGLLDVARNATALFSPFLDPTRLSAIIQRYSILPTTPGNCTAQLSLIGPLDNLPLDRFPRRRAWTQAALLWNIAMTESSSSGLLAFASSLNFSALSDSPSPSDPIMRTTNAGYVFDFSALSVAVLPSSTPPLSPAASLTPTTFVTLQRITTNAVAGSTQRGDALSHYWSELDLPLTSLPLFLAAVQRAPIVIPLDWDKVGNLSSITPFPPATACIDSLTPSQLQTINTLESNAFQLPPTTAQTNCSLDHPTYGIVNLLHLRLPFSDSDTRRSLPKQGIVLSNSIKNRCSFHAGELGLDIYGASTTPSSPSLPDRFGVVDHLQHVVLAYLTLLDRSLAKLLVEFILQPGSKPPDSSSALYQASKQLALVPVMSVQVWGGVRRSEFIGGVSSIATNDNSALFFGSSGAQEFRRWIIESNSSAGIAWSANSMSSEILLDNSSTHSSVVALTNGVTGGKSPASVWDRAKALGLAS